MDKLSISLPRTAVPFPPPPFFTGPLQTRDRKGVKWVFNPSAGSSPTTTYASHFTISKYPAPGGEAVYGTATLSAPKLLLGNSVEEVRASDAPAIIALVTADAVTAGFPVTTEIVGDATVSSLEVARNVRLPPSATATSVTFPIGQAFYSTKTDLEKLEYFGKGVGVKCHATGYEVAFYDKTEEARRGRETPNHVIDPESKSQQFPEGAVIPEDFLRYEVRYGDREVLESRVDAVGWTPTRLTFSGAFSEDLWDRLLLAELDRLDERLVVGLDPDELGRMFVEDSAARGRRGYWGRLEVAAYSTLTPILGARTVRRLLRDMGFPRNRFERIRGETAAMRERAGSRRSPVDVIRAAILEQPRFRFCRDGER